MSFIANIKEKNQFPIIFIGSGITLRYFEEAPRWEDLLIKLWTEVREPEDFYARCYDLKLAGKNNFEIYLEVASELEKAIDTAFIHRELIIPGLDIKQAYDNISPFRFLVGNIFKNLTPKKGYEEEVQAFQSMIIKARFIITTNYDTFIEDCFKASEISVKVNIGNSGLFQKSEDYGELYKIHGSIEDTNSICITKADYNKNESKLALVNAKILSNLTESPILFLGYSLTDLNIRELLSSYSENLPFEMDEAVLRIGVVEYTEGEEKLREVDAHLAELGMYYTKICTDNYLKLYQEISQVNQGMLPSELAKVNRFFKNIIEVRGGKGDLQNVVASHVDISKLDSDEIKSKNFVVAFGDERTIFKPVYYIDYLRCYFGIDDDTANFEGLLNYLVMSVTITTHLPFKKYAERALTNPDLPISQRDKLVERQKRYSLDTITSSAHASTGNSNIQLIIDCQCEKPQQVMEIDSLLVNDRAKILYIISEIREFEPIDMKDFIINILETRSEATLRRTEYRKLFTAYDLLEYEN